MNKLGVAILFVLVFGALGQSFAGDTHADSNKQVVQQFYNKALNDKDFEGAREYLGPWYIQHNPMAKDGIDGFGDYIAYLKENYPQAHSEIKRVLVDGDMVILHVHSILQPGSRGQSIIDIFRLENNKIVEHWDTTQDIPEVSANSNGMF